MILKDTLHKEDLINKVIFWDIDGTLAPYRFNGHIGDPNGTNNGQSLDEIENDIFIKRNPSKLMQNIISDCNAKQHIIMGHCINNKEIYDKNVWINIHYPIIKERILIKTNMSKADTIIDYCKLNNISISTVVFIDDVISILREAENKGISSWHISSCMDYFL